MRKFTPIGGEIYHCLNRGTEKRKIFLCKRDYERFIVNLILFNTKNNNLSNLSRYDINSACEKIPDDPVVKIHAFTLLPNHFHLILEQVENNGIAKFMHRIEMSYAHYFNKLHTRSGNLFQGAYKIKHINDDSYRLYIPLYIHLNALDLLGSEKNWKERGIKNKDNAIKFLRNYKWSSLREYLEESSFPFVSHDIFDELYNSPKEWEFAIKEWIPENIIFN